MSNYNNPRSIVVWDDVNKIHEGVRIYKSNAYIDENNLPEPYAVLSRPTYTNVYYDTNVIDNETNWYRVSVYAQEIEYVSNAVQISAVDGADIYATIQGAGNNTYVISPNSSIITEYNFVNDIAMAITVDVNRNIYVAVGNNIEKFDDNGVKQWSFSDAYEKFYDIAVDDNGYVYGANRNGSIYKIYQGNDVWVKSIYSYGTMRAVATDNLGNVYVGGTDDKVHKLDINGNMLWTVDFSNYIHCIEVDASRNVYVGDNDGFLTKINTNGVIEWKEALITHRITSLAIGTDGFLYIGGYRDMKKIRSYDGNIVWSYLEPLTADVYSMSVDLDNMVYMGTTDNKLIKLDPSGNKLWEKTLNFTVNGIDVYPGRYHISQNISL